MKITSQIDHILGAVMTIPRGRVATYGEVAEAAGLPGRARLVGRALRNLPSSSGIPWHRVVGAGGRISPRGDSMAEWQQKHLLEDEGVMFEPSGRIRLDRYGWRV
jgi:methylated-DNA-protein-cysteine methyltransferase-like protein